MGERYLKKRRILEFDIRNAIGKCAEEELRGRRKALDRK
jgi:hypothetical protein